MALARRLVAAGCPDQSWEARAVDGQRRFFGKSLHRLAQLRIKELSERSGIAIVPWNALSDSSSTTFYGVEGSPLPKRRPSSKGRKSSSCRKETHYGRFP
jgi:hypothetical protein